ncbi:MAG: glycosyltransferase [Bryobacterales bacterium]|nr:glycosyltransferase [Bryobacterales bacterium]
MAVLYLPAGLFPAGGGLSRRWNAESGSSLRRGLRSLDSHRQAPADAKDRHISGLFPPASGREDGGSDKAGLPRDFSGPEGSLRICPDAVDLRVRGAAARWQGARERSRAAHGRERCAQPVARLDRESAPSLPVLGGFLAQRGRVASGPIVTIVTPSLNQGRFIRATIESVLAQDYPHLEYIVMDGGSSDSTAAIAAEYGSRLKWVSEPDSGQSHAINKGFQVAKGEIVSWLNSDDLILPGAVSHAVEAFKARPETGAVYGEGYQIDETGAITRRFPYTEPFNLWKLVFLSDYILQQTVYFRKSAIEAVGYLDEDLHYGMDWDILIRLGLKFGLEHVPEYMGCLREYPEAKTSAGGAARIRELRRILRKYTGMRFPPGYVTYGLDSWQSRTPEWFRPAARVLAGFGSLAVTRQGWYGDGWAAPRSRFMLPPGGGGIVVRGTLPPEVRALRGQRLRVESCGATLVEAPLPPGDFEVRAPFQSSEAIHLTLLANKATMGRDLRRRSYVLRSVQWETANRLCT